MSSANYTIDDSQWSTTLLTLSPGWNMLNSTSSNFISASQVDQIRPLLPNFYGGSYSWNTHAGCSNTITFVGTSITAYGLAGPDSGEYSAILDGDARMMSSKQPEVNWDHILFTVDGLEEGQHTLSFTNLVEGNWFGFDYASVSTVSSVRSSSPPKNFNLPEGLLVPAHMLTAGQPTPSQLALITPYKPHWTPGAYFVVFVAGVALASLYVFFLFQFAGMLRDKAEEDSCPVTDKRKQLPRFAQQEAGYNKRFSWAAGLEGMNQEKGDDGVSERGETSEKVKYALKLKQISGPSPVPEKEDVVKKEFKQLSINTASSEASGSGSGSGSGSANRDVEASGEGSGSGSENKRDSTQSNNKRNSTQSQNGTWPRRPGSFPRLSFSASSPSSPRSPCRTPRVTPGLPTTPGGRSLNGYF